MWYLARQETEQNRTQQVDIASWAQQIRRSDHLRCHVTRRAACGGRHVFPGFGQDRQPPVQHQHLTKTARHDVLGFQVTVDHPFGMGKRDRVAHVYENLEVLVQCQGVNGLVPCSPLDVLHRIEECSACRFSHLVNRDDVGMLQLSCQDRLGQEFFPNRWLLARLTMDLLQSHLPSQGHLLRQMHGAHSTFTQLVQCQVVQAAHAGSAAVGDRLTCRLDAPRSKRLHLGY